MKDKEGGTAENKEAEIPEIADAEGGDSESVSSHDSISFSSSTYLSGNTSFTRKKIDGSLDVNKLMGWTLPKLDISLLHLGKGGHKSCSFNPADEASAASTP